MAIEWTNAGQVHTNIQRGRPNVHCVGSKLCNDGQCKYALKQATGITDKWLCGNLSPNITASFGNDVGMILVKSLLWAAFDVECSERLAPKIKHRRILSAFIWLEQGVGMRNPVQNVKIIAMEVDGIVLLVKMIVTLKRILGIKSDHEI